MMNTISDLFGRSPIKPIQEHMKCSLGAAEELAVFFQASKNKDWETAEKSYNTITDIEHEADEYKISIRLNLPHSLFLPVPRQDLLELLTAQDKVANISKDISGLMLGRKMSFPSSLQDTINEYVESAIKAVRQAHKAVNELDELLEFGFKGKELNIVERLVKHLDELEHEADLFEIQVRRQLYAIESELPPIDAMFLYKIIEQIGTLADRAQKVGSRLLLLVAR